MAKNSLFGRVAGLEDEQFENSFEERQEGVEPGEVPVDKAIDTMVNNSALEEDISEVQENIDEMENTAETAQEVKTAIVEPAKEALATDPSNITAENVAAVEDEFVKILTSRFGIGKHGVQEAKNFLKASGCESESTPAGKLSRIVGVEGLGDWLKSVYERIKKIFAKVVNFIKRLAPKFAIAFQSIWNNAKSMKESLNKINYSGELKFSAEQAKDIRKKFGAISLAALATKSINGINYALMDAYFIKQKSISDRFKKITTASIDLTNKYASMTPVQLAELYKDEKNGTKTIADELVTILGTDAVAKLDEAVMSIMEDPETELVGSHVLGLNSLGVAYKFVVLTEGGEQKDRSFTPKIATLKLKTEYIDKVQVTPLSKSEAMKLCDRFIGQDKNIWEKIKDLDSVFNKYDLILDKIGKMISTDADDNELDGVKEGIDYIAGIVRIFGSTVITETIYTDIKVRKAAMEYIAESKKLMEEKASDKKNGISGSTKPKPETEPTT
jgi:hypothetical protein